MNTPQSRLLLLPGELLVNRGDGSQSRLKVFIVDRQVGGYGYSLCTIVMREPVPADVTWTGTRLPGAIVSADGDDVTVDLEAVEAGLSL